MNVLKNKCYKTYNRFSRYSSFPYYYNALDDKYVTATTSNLDDSTSYALYTVVEGDTYDIIALKKYNNPTYYWIICDINRIFDPFLPPEPDSKLKIPDLSTLKFLS